MIVAVDRVTGEVVGQVVQEKWMSQRDESGSFYRLSLLLTAKGYEAVPADSVRLEKVS